VKFATIELTCSMLEPDADEGACATWDETADMYRGAVPLVDAVGGTLRVSAHEERDVEYRDAYADVSQGRLEDLLDLFDEDSIGYDNIDLRDRPSKTLLKRLRMRYPRGSGVAVNEKYSNNPREMLAGKLVPNPAGTFTLYHGTHARFDKPTEFRVTRGGADYGPGFYMTTDPREAAEYGRYVYVATVKLESPLDLLEDDPEALKKLQRGLKINDEDLEYADNKTLEALRLAALVYSQTAIRNFLMRLGYDGIYAEHRLVEHPRTDVASDFVSVLSLEQILSWELMEKPGALVANADRETFAEQIARMRRERDAFSERVRDEVERTGAFIAPVGDERASLRRTGSYRGWVSITRSTRPGIAWQVTFWEGDPRGPDATPTGHLDVSGDLADAAREIIGLASP